MRQGKARGGNGEDLYPRFSSLLFFIRILPPLARRARSSNPPAYSLSLLAPEKLGASVGRPAGFSRRKMLQMQVALRVRRRGVEEKGWS